jgi:hypothetical protein
MKAPDEQKSVEDSFGAYVAGKLNQFDKIQRIMAEKRIFDVLFQTEMEITDTIQPGHSPYQGSYGFPPQYKI